MNTELVERLRKTQQTLEPRAKALRAATGALAEALKLAGEEKADALPMQKTLLKLQGATERVDDEALRDATAHFQAETERALGALAFEFARALREAFSARGLEVAGRPPTLAVNDLTLNLDMAARKAGWSYGREALTRPSPCRSALSSRRLSGRNGRFWSASWTPGRFWRSFTRLGRRCSGQRAAGPRSRVRPGACVWPTCAAACRKTPTSATRSSGSCSDTLCWGGI